MGNTSVRLGACLLVLSLVGAAPGDLTGHWKFDEGAGATAKDSSGKGHDGTVLGIPEWVTGAPGLGDALGFSPGTCTGADCGVFDPTNGKGKFTVALWAFWDGTGTFQHFLTKSNGWGTTTMMFQFELWGAHSVATYTDRVGISYDPDSTAFSIMPKNEWAHLAWTFDGSKARLYLNGIDEVGPKTLKIGPNVAAPVLIGRDFDGGRVFHGTLDDVQLHDRVLTPDEVAAICPPPRTAKEPDPPDGAVGVNSPLFKWKAGYKGVLHEVYMGKTPELGAADLVQPRNTALFHFHGTPLDPGTTYYWRVDENVPAPENLRIGPVWSFTTHLPIDDFESYNDDEGKGTRIYETWIDGWTNSNGSTVGNVDPPFAERTIVHRGLQCMPMDYNNVDAPHYSEAERTWSKPQDWTADGLAVLILSVQGLSTNQPGRLYLVVKDSTNHTATVVHPDALAYRTPKWFDWKIPLSSFSDAGVKLTAVKSLAIGVGDRNATAPGGKGKIYLDDIRLTRP